MYNMNRFFNDRSALAAEDSPASRCACRRASECHASGGLPTNLGTLGLLGLGVTPCVRCVRNRPSAHESPQREARDQHWIFHSLAIVGSRRPVQSARTANLRPKRGVGCGVPLRGCQVWRSALRTLNAHPKARDAKPTKSLDQPTKTQTDLKSQANGKSMTIVTTTKGVLNIRHACVSTTTATRAMLSM